MAWGIEKLRLSNEALNKKLEVMLERQKMHQKLTEKLLYIDSNRRDNNHHEPAGNRYQKDRGTKQ